MTNSRAKLFQGVHAKWIVFAAIGIATLLKIYCAANTYGSVDTWLFSTYADLLHRAGLKSAYATTLFFNHTPSLAMVLLFTRWCSVTFSLPFPLLLRLPGIAADVVSCLVLWRLATKQMAGRLSAAWVCLFALNPVSFMISGYFGNYDTVLAMFVFLAAYYCVAENMALSAACFAFALLVKVAPLIVSPVFFFYWLHRGKGLHFSAIIAGILAGAWIVPILSYPALLLRNVFAYNGCWGNWGVSFWLSRIPYAPFQKLGYFDLTPAEDHVITALKIGIMSAICFIAWRRAPLARESVFKTLSWCWAVFFVFTPGAFIHYLPWPSGVTLLHARRWWLALCAGGTVFTFYTNNLLSGGMPWDKWSHMTIVTFFSIGPWSNFAWLVYVAFLGSFFLLRERPGEEVKTPDNSAESAGPWRRAEVFDTMNEY